MKQTKERVLYIDYFRGLCMLALVLNHAYLFTMPLAYLTGVGRLWTSTSELFFLISGLTFGVVRSKHVRSSFAEVVRKGWLRSKKLYLLNLITVFGSLALASVIATLLHKTPDIIGQYPTGSTWSLLASIISLKYIYGSASFLAYYAVFLLLAPFALKALYGRRWAIVPALSIIIFLLTASPLLRGNSLFEAYIYFFVWQLYFFIGLTIARFRRELITTSTRISRLRRFGGTAIISITTIVMAVSAYLAFSFPQHFVNVTVQTHDKLRFIKPEVDWLFLNRASFDHWLTHERTGLLRPIISLLVLASMYIIYKRYETALQRNGGKFVNTVGRHSLDVYIYQAAAIPVLTALPLSHARLASKLVLATMLYAGVWLLVERDKLKQGAVSYMEELSLSYRQSKANYLRRLDDLEAEEL